MTIALRVQILFILLSIDNISQMSWGVLWQPCYVQCAPCSVLPQPTNLMRGGQAWHCGLLLVLVTFDIPRNIFKQLNKTLQKPCKQYCVIVFCAVIWVLKVPFFTLMLYCRAIILASYVTQPKIATIISTSSGVL